MEIEIINASGSKPLGKIQLTENNSIKDVKVKIHQKINKSLYPDRQAIKLEAKGKTLKDEDSLKSLNLQSGAVLYVKDLGPQISWKNVFLAEYAGPLFVYLWVYQRPWIIYGPQNTSPGAIATVAAVCWSGHYAKRLLETLFVHRFSHGTMPLRNLFRNCAYYWLFTLYVAYHINHPLYTAPCNTCFYVGLAGFIFCELGNLSIHILLKNLRPPGTKVRKIPVPDGNPFSRLFNFVSCPNYTYEFGSWLFFTIMTKCAPAGLFAAAGFYQMAVWAIGKHRNYKKEFPDYPKGRKAIIPFIL
ncbi:probable very-long-chain enoyl-CoA reductase art-1 [Pectinophora gossypiella]|uniref:very-long-chain enoyl-CoA reductase n=1 Tax=Pectinophora gossypiella TaxID=13191 RepID=A0A1E1WGZ1_PECGO|nr:probable very-long-chain enoyl-CoA reductase art-1 [Pectinophora gossypiella]